MLQELKVSQFAIIDNLHIEFQNGFNVISGETGSGKSILLKSLGLLMGEKASSDVIRTGATQAVVEGAFNLKKRPDIRLTLNAAGIDTEDNTLIVKRIIAPSDKSKVYLNGSLCTLTQLKEIVSPMIEVTGHNAPLIEMTGQHDNRHLLSKAYHLDLLDQYAGHFDKRLQYEEKYSALQSLKTQITDFETQAQQKSQRLDFLKFQIAELNKVNVQPETDAHLEDEIKTLKSAHKVLKFVDDCESLLFNDEDSVSSRLKTVQKKAVEFSHLGTKWAERMQSLQQAQELIEDTFFALRKDLNQTQLDPEQLESKEERLSQIRKLQKKYGSDLNEIASSTQKIAGEIATLENSDEHLEKIKKQARLLELELKQLAEELHKVRVKSSEKLEAAVNKELLDLNMKGVSFSIGITKLESLNSTGLSEVEYLCQTSPKDPKRPISKVASGGELSRILLSLKKALGESERPRTYLFDEVDTGVSGNTAEKVGKKLKTIAKGQQVICVTHLPQVAACGDIHFSINKDSSKNGVHMVVRELKSKTRIEEIARLISGEKITNTSLAHAEQLLSESLG
jgi:DNA repair protein RecN (Recombination protein N)